jgi:hypothetical protein
VREEREALLEAAYLEHSTQAQAIRKEALASMTDMRRVHEQEVQVCVCVWEGVQLFNCVGLITQ